MSERRELCVVSYNIHRCLGRDGRFDPARVARVIRALAPDLAGLQEVDNRFGPDHGSVQLALLAGATGLRGVSGPALRRPEGHYGNALLSRHPVRAIRRLDLSFPGREPRGALDVDLDVRGRPLRVVVTHLGLRPAERRFQVRRLLGALASGPPGPLVLMGDFNEWFPPGRPARWLHRPFGRSPAPATFPAVFPLFSLDRILVRPREALRELRALRGGEAGLASDHLPLRALIALP